MDQPPHEHASQDGRGFDRQIMGDRLIEQDLARRGEVLVPQPEGGQERDPRQGLKNIGSAGQVSWFAASGSASIMECIEVQPKNLYHLISAIALKSSII